MVRSKMLQGLGVLLMTVVLVMGSEVFLLMMFPDRAAKNEAGVWYIPSKDVSLAFHYNPDYLVSLKPSVTKTYIRSEQNGGQVIHWSTNAHGFRGPELREEPNLRIIVYGDSNVQARFSLLESTFPVRLGYHLEELGTNDVEVINAGLVGAGPDQQLIRLTREIGRFRPDIVVFHVFADNDFGDLVRNRLFDVDLTGKLTETSHERTIDYQLLGPEYVFDNMFHSLLTVRALKTLIEGLLPSWNPSSGLVAAVPPAEIIEDLLSLAHEEHLIYEKGKPRVFSHFGDHYDADVAIYPDSPSSLTKIRLMEAVLHRAQHLTEENGSSFVVVIQPSRRDLVRQVEGDIGLEDLGTYDSYSRTRLTDIVEEICRANEIAFLNLYEPFLTNAPGQLFFHGRNDHWNDAGQEVASREAAAQIFALLARDPQ